MAPPSRPTQDVRANSKLGAGPGIPVQENAGPQLPQVFSGGGELEWVSTSVACLHQPDVSGNGSETAAEIRDSHIGKLKIVPNPPDLEIWRERLFHVDEPVTLTEDQYALFKVNSSKV
jgi:glutathione S-transferase